MVQVDNIFPIVFEKSLEGFFIPIATESFPEAHGLDSVNPFG